MSGSEAIQRNVCLIDGSGYIFRAFYAITNLSTSGGFPTNALFGFTRMLLKLLREVDSEHIAVIFDAARKTFRHDIYPEYKANRAECPEELAKQMPYFRDISRALGLPVIELLDFEADDIIGTLTRRLSKAHVQTTIVTGDKDLMQLVDDQVTIWDTMRDIRYDREGVRAKLGVYPEQVGNFLGLTGDSSDNVPGVKGIGPKTAVQLIETYKDIDNIIGSVERIRNDRSIRNRSKIAEQIEQSVEALRLSRRLVEIQCAAPVKLSRAGAEISILELNHSELLDILKRDAPDIKTLSTLTERFEFNSLLNDFDISAKPADTGIFDSTCYLPIFADEFSEFVEMLGKQSAFAFDIESTSLDVKEARLCGVSFCWSAERAYYVPIGHKSAPKPQTTLEEFFEKAGPILNDPKVQKIGQNLKYDIGVLAELGLEVQGLSFDTMLAAYLLNPDKSSYKLSTLAAEFLAAKAGEYMDVVGGLDDFSSVPIDAAVRYAAEDAHCAWLLKVKLAERIEQQGLCSVLADIEMPLVAVLSRMERIGIRLDTSYLQSMSVELGREISLLEEQIYEQAGSRFNLNSPKQLSDVLFNKLGIPTRGLKRTKTGVSTDSSVLERLAVEHTLPTLILQYRMLHKLCSTYVDALPLEVSKKTGRLHTHFNQTVTGTGRLSSSEPNIQNIPIQTSAGRRVRAAFIPDNGKVLISADYSQIELRILAHISGDDNLIEAFRRGEDIHSKTAHQILNIPPQDDLTPEQRRIGKTINFGVIYGMSGFRLGRDLGIPINTATAYIEEYFGNYPNVRKLFKELEEQAANKGYVTTIFGRRRVIGDIDTAGRDRNFLARVAVNAPIQGSAADIIKLAMIRLDRRLIEERLDAAMLLQIHDELVFECSESLCDKISGIIRSEMEGVMELKAPLKVDIGVGRNWQEAHG